MHRLDWCILIKSHSRLRINPNFPVIVPMSKDLQEEFLFAGEKKNKKDILPKQVCKCFIYEWPILERFTGKCCSIVSCLDRPSITQSWSILFNANVDLPPNKTKNQPNLTKTHTNQLTSETYCSLSALYLSCGYETEFTTCQDTYLPEVLNSSHHPLYINVVECCIRISRVKFGFLV